jgi:hypothetical protein
VQEEIRKLETMFFFIKRKTIDPLPLPHKKANQMYLSSFNPIQVIRVQPNAG